MRHKCDGSVRWTTLRAQKYNQSYINLWRKIYSKCLYDKRTCPTWPARVHSTKRTYTWDTRPSIILWPSIWTRVYALLEYCSSWYKMVSLPKFNPKLIFTNFQWKLLYWLQWCAETRWLWFCADNGKRRIIPNILRFYCLRCTRNLSCIWRL